MINIGEYNKLIICKKVDFGCYLSEGEDEILLPGAQLADELKIGEEIEVFVYTDSEDRPIATLEKPLAVVDQFAVLKVNDINKFGAFLEWGLQKDLMLPHREQFLNLSIGQKVPVFVYLDEVSERVVASNRIGLYLNLCHNELKEDDQVEIILYQYTELGCKVIVNRDFNGLVFDSDLLTKPAIGTITTGYVKKVRPDGKLDITLNRSGYKEVISEDAPKIIDRLKRADGFLPYNAKTSADEVRRVFNMSRKAFKKIIGNLYKQKIIDITDKGIQLKEK